MQPTMEEEGYAAFLARQRAVGRQCGGCTMCCKVLGVDAPPQLSKPPDTSCVHCAPGKGCKIYDRRPLHCRYFFCQWLIDDRLGDELHPAKSHIVVSLSPTEGAFIVEVDRDRPGRWLQQPYFDLISGLALGVPGTTVRVGKRWYVIIPAETAKHPENSRVTWRSQRLPVRRGAVGSPFVSVDGEFVWMEVEATEESNDAWRASAESST